MLGKGCILSMTIIFTVAQTFLISTTWAQSSRSTYDDLIREVSVHKHVL